MMTGGFLKSKVWRSLRESVLNRDGSHCFLCGSKDRLCVHHILYRRFYKDLQDKENNLVTVCSSCHFRLHKDSLGLMLMEMLRQKRPRIHQWILDKLKTKYNPK